MCGQGTATLLSPPSKRGSGPHLEQRERCLAGEEVRHILPTQHTRRLSGGTAPSSRHARPAAAGITILTVWQTSTRRRRSSQPAGCASRRAELAGRRANPGWAPGTFVDVCTHLLNVVGRDDDVTGAAHSTQKGAHKGGAEAWWRGVAWRGVEWRGAGACMHAGVVDRVSRMHSHASMRG